MKGQRWLSHQSTSHRSEHWDASDCSACSRERSGRNLIYVQESLKGACKEDGTTFFPVVHNDRTGGNRHKLKNRRFLMNIMKCFTLRVERYWYRLFSEVVIFIPGHILNLSEHSPMQPAGKLDKMTSRGPLQHQLFHDSAPLGWTLHISLSH